MELMKRDFLTVTDDGENICMSLDTAHEDVQKVGKKMAEIRTGIKMDGKVDAGVCSHSGGPGLAS